MRLCWSMRCLVLLASATLLRAQTYYVATNGDDATGDGSSGNPWASITHAVDSVPDGSLVLVRPGTYNGVARLDHVFATGVTVRSETAYQARLRNMDTVVRSFYGSNIAIEGFDIAHDPNNVNALVIQVQDLLGAYAGVGPSGTDPVVHGIIFRNNIIHDSTNNDLLKINNSCEQVLVEGNMLFNQQGSDEHIDINSVRNVTVQGNVFFNQIPGNLNDTSSFIIMKDSNATSDSILGVHDITVRRNVFLSYEGSDGTGFLGVGEDGMAYYEGYSITIENNLLLGNSGNLARTCLSVKGGKDVTFRNNTVVGDLPTRSYALRLIQEGSNPPNDNVRCYNNVWPDPTGTMGAEGYVGIDFAESPPSQNLNTMVLGTNLYHNGGQAIPPDPTELVNYTDDATRVVADPLLPSQSGLVVPYWDGSAFADGSATIREAWARLVDLYGKPGGGSPAIDAADPANAPADDILGNPRGSSPDIGAYEVGAGVPTADFSGTPRSGPAPLAVTFTDLSTGTIASWAWTFGDGGTSSAQNPSHTYATTGSYTVSLTVTGSGSDTETKPGYITVTGSSPVENFVSGRGRGQPNANDVAIHSLGGVLRATFAAYAAGQWGTLVSAGDVDGSGLENPLTGPGPGAVYGPQVRAWQASGAPIAKVNFYAYGTLRYGVNIGAAALDGDGPLEILSGAGPGAVFGPHVRGWNYDGVTLAAIAKISYYAYGTLKYGVNVGSSDVDGDAFSEILTGPGTSAAFGTQVRGFNYDGIALGAIGKINFNAFGSGAYGVNVGGEDGDGDAFGEIVAGRGPGPALASDVAGFDYDASAISALPGYAVTLGATFYGARGGCGDIDGDGQGELVAGAGEDPAAPALVQSYDYTGFALAPIGTGTFNAFGSAYGVTAGSGVFGY